MNWVCGGGGCGGGGRLGLKWMVVGGDCGGGRWWRNFEYSGSGGGELKEG